MDNGRLYTQMRYEQILEEQVAISYASKGISIEDTDALSPFDRELILRSIMKIKEAEAEASERAMNPGIRRNISRF